ncbi:MAG: DUF6504 family protein [Planctomycetota bacterium]|nr:DUF6504 family protein [Planctomycetota bacterium]
MAAAEDPARGVPERDPAPADGEAREFVSEPLVPDPTSFSREGVAPGEPAWPRRFRWRTRDYEVATILRAWKTTSAGPYTTGDVYVRRHYADVITVCGTALRLYGDRGGRAGRWFVHSRGR